MSLIKKEVSAKKKWECQSKLLKHYSRKIKTPEEYPNGIRLRFVKLRSSGVNKVEKSKMDKLRQRQQEFFCHPRHADRAVDRSDHAQQQLHRQPTESHPGRKNTAMESADSCENSAVV